MVQVVGSRQPVGQVVDRSDHDRAAFEPLDDVEYGRVDQVAAGSGG